MDEYQESTRLKVEEAENLIRNGKVSDGLELCKNVIHQLLQNVATLAESQYNTASDAPPSLTTNECKETPESVISGSKNNMKLEMEAGPATYQVRHGVRSMEQELSQLDAFIDSCICKDVCEATWADIIGQSEAKQAIKDAIEIPFKFPWFFKGRLNPPQGILLYGPPGVAKTKLVETAAYVSKATFFKIRGSDVKSRWLGTSEKFVKCLFAKVKKFRKSIVFLDEMEGILLNRQDTKAGHGIVQEFLAEMDGGKFEESWFVVIGATNHPNFIDGAIRRRFERHVRLSMPNFQERKEMFNMFLKVCNHQIKQEDFSKLALLTEGNTGSDIAAIVRKAVMTPLGELNDSEVNCLDDTAKQKILHTDISLAWLKDAIKAHEKTVTPEMIFELDRFDNNQTSALSIRKSKRRTPTEYLARKF